MPYSTAAEIVVLRDPSKTSDSRLTDMVAYARSLLDEDCWCDEFETAVALLTLHLYAKQTQSTGGGPLTSETEGRLSRSYGASGSSTDWGTTGWGRELEELQKSCVVFPRNRRM